MKIQKLEKETENVFLFKEEEGKQTEKKMHWEIKIPLLLVYTHTHTHTLYYSESKCKTDAVMMQHRLPMPI